VLGQLTLVFAPNVEMIDYFGFGYLLPTLLAVKMWIRTDRCDVDAHDPGGNHRLPQGNVLAFASHHLA
jgi:hypothetical protein